VPLEILDVDVIEAIVELIPVVSEWLDTEPVIVLVTVINDDMKVPTVTVFDVELPIL
jgi:hypothetical protein